MRHLFSFFVGLIFLTGCKSPEEKPQKENKSSPKEIVLAYLSATNHFDIKSAEKFLILNKENAMTLETLKKMEKSLPDNEKLRFAGREKNALYFEKEVNDSTAQIIVTPNQDVVMPIEFNLKKVKENWLIESMIVH